MFGALRLLTITMSKRPSLPRTHWPPTSGVFRHVRHRALGPADRPDERVEVRGLDGGDDRASCRRPLAARLSHRETDLEQRVDEAERLASTASSSRAYYSAANALAVVPVSDDLNGCCGVHHTSVDMPFTERAERLDRAREE